MAEVIVLDLDDTLYLERDYARSGFAAVGWICCPSPRAFSALLCLSFEPTSTSPLREAIGD